MSLLFKQTPPRREAAATYSGGMAMTGAAVLAEEIAARDNLSQALVA